MHVNSGHSSSTTNSSDAPTDPRRVITKVEHTSIGQFPLGTISRQESRSKSYVNETYDPSLDDRNARGQGADQGVLLPDPKDVKFWWRLFKRGDEEMNGSKITLQQGQGAQVLEVGAGQMDPLAPEILTTVEKSGQLEVPYKARRTPSPMQTSSPLLVASNSDDLGQLPLGVSGPSTSSDIRSTLTTPQKQAAARLVGIGRKSRMGHSMSSKREAGDIKTIGQEAMSQLRAEAGQVDGEMWARSDGNDGQAYAPGMGIGEGRAPSASGDTSTGRENPQPGLSVRQPSESNPWASTRTKPSQSASESTNGKVDNAQVAIPEVYSSAWSNPEEAGKHGKEPLGRDASCSIALRLVSCRLEKGEEQEWRRVQCTG